jgi:predicted PurR-regulated permease PerM
MLAYDYPLLGAFWTMTFFFLWAAWIFAVIWVFVDNFRRRDHSGWAKALWTLVIIFVPVVGVLVYIIVRPRELATV